MGCEVFSAESLRSAWDRVLSNDETDGVLSMGVARFRENAADRLAQLTEDLSAGTYRVGPLTEVAIESGGKTRTLHIPTVPDRIVARTILSALTHVVDPVLGPASYAYRPGLGVADAVQAVAALRDEGLGWVLRTDIDDCFPTVPTALAARMIDALIVDDHVSALIHQLLGRRVRGGGSRAGHPLEGLPQGCALSPMLANLVLSTIDEDILGAGFALVRYADDLVIVVASSDEAWEAARMLTHSLEGLGMQLGADKTEVMSFEKGFCFLGEDFGPRYPPTLQPGPSQPPLKRVLYLAPQGGRVRTEAGRLVVESADDAELLDVPTERVSRLVCFGSVGVSAGVRSWAMSGGVSIVFASRRGSYQGHLVGKGSGPKLSRVRAQLAFSDDHDAALSISQAIVEAKIRKQIVVLQRFNRREHADVVATAVRQIQQTLLLVPDCTSAEEVMGIEGAAARAYFPAYGALMPQGMNFNLRSRRPPLDVPNAALSFLYTIMMSECVTALYAAGLDPAIGVLHADDDDRPSLALDLMEELRPLLVDQVVLQLARKGTLTPQDRRTDPHQHGVLLSKAGRDVVVAGYEARMQQQTRGAIADFAGSWRRHVYRQAQRLSRVVTEGDPTLWTALSWR